MNIEFGNIGNLDTNETGWFLGYSDWTKSTVENLRHMPLDINSKGLCAKWYVHKAGDPNGEPKPISVGRTISILVSEDGKFKVDFCGLEAFETHMMKSHILKKSGDFVIWGADIYHRAFCLKSSTMLTIRWNPEN